MTETREGEGPRPVRLALLLALFLVPGAIGAAVLWHDVLNEVLAGRPMKASVWTVSAMLLLMGLSIGLLARWLRGGVSDRDPNGVSDRDRGGVSDRDPGGVSDRGPGGTGREGGRRDE